MRRRQNLSEQSDRQHRESLLRPPNKSFWRQVRDFIWDSNRKMCMTRTPRNWLSITIYYIIFLGVVILIFYLTMLLALYIASSNHGRPQYILDDSPIGSSPTLNFFPMIDNRPLIYLSKGRSYKDYVDDINEVFKRYKKMNSSFDTSQFGECAQPPFGYDVQAPCLFFRLNRIIMWKPTPYEKIDQLPDNAPAEVKDLVSNSSSPKVWISCNGSQAKDRDHMDSAFFQFQGTKGFDTSVFPYDRQKNFIDPIVAMKLNDSNPQKVLYSFTCVAWSNKLSQKSAQVDVVYYFE